MEPYNHGPSNVSEAEQIKQTQVLKFRITSRMSVIFAVIPTVSLLALSTTMDAIGETSEYLAIAGPFYAVAGFFHVCIHLLAEGVALGLLPVPHIVALCCMMLEAYSCGIWTGSWLVLAGYQFEWKYAALEEVCVVWFGVIVLVMVVFMVVVIEDLMPPRLGRFASFTILGSCEEDERSS
ncbi:hypothetical protein AX16_004057 [Volvariella volvacea WC 439]|nr:hypothetical protein AX16_004057 [Volvariella volvacea WC 439]